MNKMEFSDWITQKYIDWRGSTIGQAGSVSEFAKVFGAPQSLMSEWMKKGGKTPNSQKYLNALVKVYGNEAYAALNLPVPEMTIDAFPDDFQQRFQAAARELIAAKEARGLYGTEPEVLRLASEILEKHGFKYLPTGEE